MLESFLNPWTFAAGAGLVSVPIIIHLINRMRFRRVKWAAMEFLLKAQKRMKRKLIFQQLLLLALRCLMVFLLAVLFGRFLGFDPARGKDTRLTAHVAVLDDSPSMGDGWRGEDGQPTDSFAQLKRVLVEQIGPAAAQATTPQTLDAVWLSDPRTPRSFGRLNTTSINEVKSYLDGFQPSPVRGGLAAAIRKAGEVFPASDGKDLARVVHVLSDFRASDWEQDGPAVKQEIDKLTAQKVKVHLVDVAHPFRKDEKPPPLYHDNVGVTSFRALRPVVAKGQAAEFELSVKNFGVGELRDVRFAVAVNGDDNKGMSVNFPSLPGGQEKFLKFELALDRVATADKPLDRFSLVTVRMAVDEAGGIAADNVRHAVVEVREKLPILIVEGKPAARDAKDGDSFYVRRVLSDVVAGYALVNGTTRDLEQGDLRPYSCVLMLNVPAVSEAAAKNLDLYVRDGGGVGFFLGPDVKPDEYNKQLYANGAGLFPVPLPAKFTEPLSDDKVAERLFSPQQKILLRDAASARHPAVVNFYFDERGNPESKKGDIGRFFLFVLVKQYWPIQRIGNWLQDPAVTEIYCLPNDKPIGNYDALVVGLLDKIKSDEPKYEKYRELLTARKAELRRTALSTEPLYKLSDLLDALLADGKGEGTPDEAKMREFWSLPENAAVRQDAARLRDLVKFGDPLYLAKKHGRGRVALVTTTAGEAWTNWPSAPPGNASFSPVVKELEAYLSGGGSDENRSVGSPLELQLDANRYKPFATRGHLTFDPVKGAPRADGGATFTDLKDQSLVPKDGKLALAFTETAKPGAYLLTLTQLRSQSAGAEAAEVPEYLGYAFNIDARREGDLRRAARDDVVPPGEQGVFLHSVGDLAWLDTLKNKTTDWTEAGWIFLVLLGVLLAEQYLAMRLSYHTSGGAAELPAAPQRAAVAETKPEPVAAA